MRRNELQLYLDRLLETARFKDYCPNGLQVEGRADIHRVVCGVTASQALIDAAIALDADALLVHHGWFWRGEDQRVTGTRKQRLASLLAHDINLFAFHLPLDAHPDLGNNVQFAKLLGWNGEGRFGEQDLGWIGAPERTATAAELAAEVGRRLLRDGMLVGDGERTVSRVAWCTGAAQGLFEAAIAAGADMYVSGEISEPTVHLARESGVPYLAAGHHATERYGIQALGHHVARSLGLEMRFLDIDNPV
ncbi:MAG: Nif3-like dinuclear metal center hexameric protein [Rhodocyclaceae bacterium]|nr:Nif3-like dinuclear metal center hexameric protein [Rhodocyclaceae bacterium]